MKTIKLETILALTIRTLRRDDMFTKISVGQFNTLLNFISSELRRKDSEYIIETGSNSLYGTLSTYNDIYGMIYSDYGLDRADSICTRDIINNESDGKNLIKRINDYFTLHLQDSIISEIENSIRTWIDKNSIKLKLSEYTNTPGARTREQSKYSGEDYFETVIQSAIIKALDESKFIIIDTDDIYGLPAVFIDEIFYRISDSFDYDTLSNDIQMIIKDEQLYEQVKEIYYDNIIEKENYADEFE